MTTVFADTLGQLMTKADCSNGRLSRLSGIPVRTIENWLSGRVHRPRQWQKVVQIATALHLTEADANRLLRAASYSPISQLREQASDLTDKTLLQPWRSQNTLPIDTIPAPFQAIAQLPYFVGREAEIEAMQQSILQHKRVVIHNLQGMGGIGKTSLAAHIAYRLRPHFPDGVLWARVDTSSGMSILKSFAAAYGQDVSQYTNLESRARAVRAILAHKQALIVLDNVENDEQIRPLLPPDGRCAVILTARRRDLATAMGMRQIRLKPFKDKEALALFTKILGAVRVQRELEDLLDLAQILGYLPLALSIAAGRLGYALEETAVSFLTHLQQNQLHLDRLVLGDLNIRASFNVSYSMLPAPEQQFFASLGVFEGEDFSIKAVAAVANVTVTQAQNNLETLHKLSLVQLARPERYTLHPLLSTFAREQIENNVVYQRFASFFADYTVKHQYAYEYLDLDLDNIFAALRIAAEFPDKHDFIAGTNALCEFLVARGMYSEAEYFLTQARQAAYQAKNNKELGFIIRNLGMLAHGRGQQEQASQLFSQAMLIARQIDDKRLLALTLYSLGGTTYERSLYDLTEEYWLESLNLAQELGDERQIISTLNNVGVAARCLGQYQRARQYWMQGLRRVRKIDYPTAESAILANLASIDAKQGYLKRAELNAQQALQITYKIKRLRGICKIKNELAHIAMSNKEHVYAKQHLQEALRITRRIDEPHILKEVLANYGRVEAYLGNYEQATIFLQESLHIAQNLDSTSGICIAWCYTGILEKLRQNEVAAYAALQKSIKLAREIKDWFMVNENLQATGEIYLHRGDLDRASTIFQDALSTAQAHGFNFHKGKAQFALAQIAHARQDIATAKTYAVESLTSFNHIQHTDAQQVQTWLQTNN